MRFFANLASLVQFSLAARNSERGEITRLAVQNYDYINATVTTKPSALVKAEETRLQ